MSAFLRSRLGLAAVAAALLFVVLISPHGYSLTNQYFDHQSAQSITSDKKYIDAHSNPNFVYQPDEDTPAIDRPSVAVVSMLYGKNDFYIRAINTHLRHAAAFGSPTYVLRTEVIEGVWNKLVYMIHVMVAEMEKGDRGARWLMWVDADSAVVNPALPLDIFLPPADFDDVHMLASQDQSGFNAGMFFIKCHSWSVSLLANALTLPKYKPNVGVDFAEQSTLWMVMNETDNRKHVLWQPKTWFNAYQWHHGYEGDVGSMFVHFPGLDDDRWNHMGRWLNILEGPEAEKWSIDLKHTRYPSQIDEFWKTQRFGRQTLEAVHESIQDLLKAPDSVRVAVKRLEVIMGAKTDKVDMVMKGVKDVKDAVELYKDFEQEETEEEKRLRKEQEAETKKKVSAGGDEGSKKQQPGAPAIPK